MWEPEDELCFLEMMSLVIYMEPKLEQFLSSSL